MAKVALAMKDDTVQIALTSSNIKPLLKHKKQKQVNFLLNWSHTMFFSKLVFSQANNSNINQPRRGKNVF